MISELFIKLYQFGVIHCSGSFTALGNVTDLTSVPLNRRYSAVYTCTSLKLFALNVSPGRKIHVGTRHYAVMSLSFAGKPLNFVTSARHDLLQCSASRLLLQGAPPCPLFVTPCPFEKAKMTPCPFDFSHTWLITLFCPFCCPHTAWIVLCIFY